MFLSWLARNGRIALLRGIVAALVGVAVYIWPGLTLLVIALLFGGYVIFSGLTAIAYGLMLHRRCYVPLDSCKRTLRLQEQRQFPSRVLHVGREAL